MTKPIQPSWRPILSLALLCSLSGAVEPAFAQADEADYKIDIAVVEHRMAFDLTEFTVAAGSTVSIQFTNTDAMFHNLIVAAKPGGEEVYMNIAQQVMDLGAEAYAMHFVPDSDLVLAATKLLQPTEVETITFTAPAEVGPYPYVCAIPGHPRTMNGLMQVTADGEPPPPASATGSAFSELNYRYYHGRWNAMPDFDQLEPVARGRAPADLISLDGRQQEDYFGFVFEGKLPVEEAGQYLFMMRSDDGSRLYIDQQLIIDNDGHHGDGEIKITETALDAGVHDVRVEFFEFEGGSNLVLDWAGPSEKRLRRLTAHDRISDVREFIVEVEDEPQVWRVLLPDTSPRSVAVGLPGNISYCFDSETMTVPYAWHGAFINRGGMIGQGQGRGPQTVEILGTRFDVGSVERPLRMGDSATEPTVRFLGFRRTTQQVAFLYEVDGNRVTQTTAAAPDGVHGLRHRFEFAETPARPVHFLVNRSGLEVSASAGQWIGDQLTVPAEQAREFSVTVINPNP